jgi:hypothetical protein
VLLILFFSILVSMIFYDSFLEMKYQKWASQNPEKDAEEKLEQPYQDYIERHRLK